MLADLTVPLARTLRRAGVFAAALLACAAAAQPQSLDAVVAVVNDDIVLASDVLERYQGVVERLREDGRAQVPPRDVVIGQILDALVLESIQMQEAERRGVILDDETLTAAVRDYAAQGRMTVDEFVAGLAAQNISYRGFREQVRRQLTIDRVQREVVNRRVYITEQDVEELIASPFFAEQLSDEYRLGHILLPVAQGTTPQATQAIEARAKELVAELRGGGDFAALAVANSKASTALEGGDLGWRKAGRIPGLFAETALELDIGEVAEPLRNAAGFHIVKLIDRRGASQQMSAETLVRHILIKPSAIRSDEEAKTEIELLRGRALAGEDFAELATEHSEDPGSALVGGDLGWSTADKFVPEFQAAMDATEEGALSEPFRSEFGWHLLEVQGRRQQDASDEARRDYAARVLHAQRFEERLQEWLVEIRDEAFVEERLDVLGVATDDAEADGES